MPNKTIISQELPTSVAIRKNAAEVEILLTCLRDVSHPIRNFTDAMLMRKIGDRLPHVAAEFDAFITDGKILVKNQKLAEGVRLLKLLTEQLNRAEIPVSATTICDCMGWLEPILQKEHEAEQLNKLFAAHSALTT